jgi:hypothetical protein
MKQVQGMRFWLRLLQLFACCSWQGDLPSCHRWHSGIQGLISPQGWPTWEYPVSVDQDNIMVGTGQNIVIHWKADEELMIP